MLFIRVYYLLGDCMNDKVLKNIMDKRLIEDGDTIVVGLSGGPDSMALLYSLIYAKEYIDFDIVAAHVNHGVRGEDALKDQLFTERICESLNLSYFSKSVDMNGYAKEKGISSEEAGRILRYGFFRELLKDKKGKIAVAHNKNDQAETLLMRIMRGTGPDGLRGMDFIYGDIIRPILNITRDEIEEYIRINEIETVLDKTNLMPIYSRNKVRLELIPYIEENFNPEIIDSLWRLSRTAMQDFIFFEEFIEQKYKLIMKKITKDSIILNSRLFLQENDSVKLKILRRGLNDLEGSLQGFGENHFTSLLRLFNAMETGKFINLPNGIIGRVSYEDLILERNIDGIKSDFNYLLEIGDNFIEELGINLKVEYKKMEGEEYHYKNIKYIDADKVEGNLYLRNRREGDRFIPFGMKGNKKIKDYFIDEKIPRDMRDRIPLLVDDKNIIMIVGYAGSEIYKIDKTSRNVFKIEYDNV